MRILLLVLAIGFVIAGFVGLVGGIVSIVFWALAAGCLFLAWKLRPKRATGTVTEGSVTSDRSLGPNP